jgi:hypothetical protein
MSLVILSFHGGVNHAIEVLIMITPVEYYLVVFAQKPHEISISFLMIRTHLVQLHLDPPDPGKFFWLYSPLPSLTVTL